MTPRPGVVVRCVRLSSTLQPYLDGEMTDPDHVRAMAEHLEECRRCGLEAETYTTLKVALAARAPGLLDDGTRAALGRLEAFARSLAGPGAAQPGSAGDPPEPSR